VKPIPVVFHIGSLQIHTYGIGLAITFWFAYRYFARRLRAHGYDDGWLGRGFIWIIVSAIVGARAAHVIANWGFYSRNTGDILAIWHGGLTSYGGLALAVPTGLLLAHRWCKPLRLTVALDLVAPVLAVAWAVGRLLGPQLMVSGGGNPTTAWYGMAYAGQVGKRVPVPIFQSIECFVIFALALQVERFVSRRGGPIGVVVTAVMTMYGVSRFFDEYVLLPHGPGGVAVEVTSLAFVAVGLSFMGWLVWRDRARSRGLASEGVTAGDPWVNPMPGPEGESGTTTGDGSADEDNERASPGAGLVSGEIRAAGEDLA
jgi:phosphatidylglycerol:prolipoprotein diacylglycerol transferase